MSLVAIWAGLVGVSAIFFLRIHNVLVVRLAFIDDDSLWPAFYEDLPSYEAMCFNPRHWGRWTKRQWCAYVGAL